MAGFVARAASTAGPDAGIERGSRPFGIRCASSGPEAGEIRLAPLATAVFGMTDAAMRPRRDAPIGADVRLSHQVAHPENEGPLLRQASHVVAEATVQPVFLRHMRHVTARRGGRSGMSAAERCRP